MIPLTPRFSSRLMFSFAFAVSGAIFGVLTISGCGKRRNGVLARAPASAVGLMKSVTA